MDATATLPPTSNSVAPDVPRATYGLSDNWFFRQKHPLTRSFSVPICMPDPIWKRVEEAAHRQRSSRSLWIAEAVEQAIADPSRINFGPERVEEPAAAAKRSIPVDIDAGTRCRLAGTISGLRRYGHDWVNRSVIIERSIAKRLAEGESRVVSVFAPSRPPIPLLDGDGKPVDKPRMSSFRVSLPEMMVDSVRDAARRDGVHRSQWIVSALREQLDAGLPVKAMAAEHNRTASHAAGVSLNSDLQKRLDVRLSEHARFAEAAGRKPLKRSAWIERAVTQRLAVDATVVETGLATGNAGPWTG